METTGAYAKTYRRSLEDPEGFWGEAADAIDWIRRPQRVLDADRSPFYRWYPDGVLNTCYNSLDRHVAGGRADQIALIHDSAITGTVKKFTYAELKREVVALTSVLKNRGIVKGDRVIIYMPMVAEAAIAMLACSRIGAVHSVVFGGFASHELATRIDDAKPKLIISASCGLEPGRVVARRRASSTRCL
jgi:propionyl-CoA synthetase